MVDSYKSFFNNQPGIYTAGSESFEVIVLAENVEGSGDSTPLYRAQLAYKPALQSEGEAMYATAAKAMAANTYAGALKSLLRLTAGLLSSRGEQVLRGLPDEVVEVTDGQVDKTLF